MVDYPVYDPYPIWKPTKNRVPTIMANFSPEQIAAQGVWIRWETASRCPCVKINGRYGASSTCAICNGTGWIYHTKQDTQALLQSGTLNPKILDQTMVFMPGQIYMSVRGEHCPSNMDRITILDGRIRISLLGTRKAPRATISGQDAVETLAFPIVSKTIDTPNTTGDGLGTKTTYDLDVVYLRSVEPGTSTVGPELVKGVDYEIDFDENGFGQINWGIGDTKVDEHAIPNSITPNVDDSFTVTYYTMPIYRVVDFPHSVRLTTNRSKIPEGAALPLPVQFECKLINDLRELFESGGD